LIAIHCLTTDLLVKSTSASEKVKAIGVLLNANMNVGLKTAAADLLLISLGKLSKTF